MKALTLRQPWAHLILHEGKRIENRSWQPSYRGPILLHAGATMKDDEYDSAMWWCREKVRGGMGIVERLPPPDELARGGIVGIANLAFVTKSPKEATACNPWEVPGGFAWKLTDVHPLSFVKCKGALYLWEVPPGVLAELGLQSLRHVEPGDWQPGRRAEQHGALRLPAALLDLMQTSQADPDSLQVRLTDFGLAVREAL
jgi:hypothetical protein